MKVLVTGGLGLIGHNVVQRLESMGHDVLVVDNMTDYGIIPQAELNYLLKERRSKIKSRCVAVDISTSYAHTLFADFCPEVVIHLASFPRQKVVNANPQNGARWMIEGTINVLEAAVKYKARRIVYASSSMVYGDFNHCIKEDEPCHPQGQYGIMKYMGEKLVQDYERKGLIESVIIRPSAVYGPLDVEDRVISKFMLTAMRGGTLKVNGREEMLDFTFVDDAADGFVAAALSDIAAGQVYNITRGASKTLYEAAQMAVSIVGKGSIEIREKDADFPSRAALNIEKARRDIGFDPKVDVEGGFRSYFDWFNESSYWQGQLQNKQ